MVNIKSNDCLRLHPTTLLLIFYVFPYSWTTLKRIALRESAFRDGLLYIFFSSIFPENYNQISVGCKKPFTNYICLNMIQSLDVKVYV